MTFLNTVPSIRRIENDRDTLFAVEIVGRVSAADAENLFGLLEGAYALTPKLDLLVRLTEYDGVDWHELSAETIERGKADALAHIERCATIGEPNWIPRVEGFFTSLPVELKHFDADDEAEAWAWLGAKPVDEA